MKDLFSKRNHRGILDSLLSIIIYFTLTPNKSTELYKLIQEHGLSEHFCFLGPLSFNDVLSYYKSVDLIVFPSRLETFGLPLIEAATIGKPIVAIDLIYAREALQNYKGVSSQLGSDLSRREHHTLLLLVYHHLSLVLFYRILPSQGLLYIHENSLNIEFCHFFAPNSSLV